MLGVGHCREVEERSSWKAVAAANAAAETAAAMVVNVEKVYVVDIL